jgi:hypothetical protein
VSNLYVYPRLPRSQALVLLHEFVDADIATARSGAAVSHPAAAPVAVGPQKAPDHVIELLADSVREVATSLGYPGPLSRARVSRFDQPCGELLLERMQIVPADAANEDVWSFLTLVVLPDVALWRFPDMKDERFLGRPRNTFRRLWWRAFTLSGENTSDYGTSDPLGEDELVTIFERPSIARTAGLARAMTRAVRGLPATPGVPRSDVMRELAKRMRRLLSYISFDLLERADLDTVVEAELAASVAAIRNNN